MSMKPESGKRHFPNSRGTNWVAASWESRAKSWLLRKVEAPTVTMQHGAAQGPALRDPTDYAPMQILSHISYVILGKSITSLSLSFFLCKMGLPYPSSKDIHRQEPRVESGPEKQAQLSQCPPPRPWSSRYLPDASHPVMAMVICSCLPSVRGRNVNSSMAPTRFFILYPKDPDTTMRMEVTGDPGECWSDSRTVSANHVPSPWTDVSFLNSLR